MQFFVTTAPAPGFPAVWRAGRPWKKEGVMVEVVQERDDPKAQPDGGPMVIGQNTWEQLKADPRIFARPAGSIEDIASVSVALASARAEVDALKAKVGDLEETAKMDAAKIADLTARLAKRDEYIATLESQAAEGKAATEPAAPPTAESEPHKGKGKKG